MGLRKDFLIHKRRTIESFIFVKSDVSGILANIEHIRKVLASLDMRISALDNEMALLRSIADRFSSDISMQQSNSQNMVSEIESVKKSLANSAKAIGLSEDKTEDALFKNQALSRKIISQEKLIKGLLSGSKLQYSAGRKLSSELRIYKGDISKIKNLLNRKLSTVKKKDSELEAKIKSQRGTIASLNRKIEGKKAARKPSAIKSAKKKIAPKKAAPKKILSKKTLPKRKPSKISVIKRKVQDKTVITVKTPGKTLIEAVTPGKKEIVKVIRGKNPLI